MTLDYPVEYHTCMTEYDHLQEVLNQQVADGWNLVGVYPAMPQPDRDDTVTDYYMSVWQRPAPDTKETPWATP